MLLLGSSIQFLLGSDISENCSQYNKLEVNISVGPLVGVREKDTMSCLVGLFLWEGLSAETQFSSADRACVIMQPAQHTSVQMLQRRNHLVFHVFNERMRKSSEYWWS